MNPTPLRDARTDKNGCVDWDTVGQHMLAPFVEFPSKVKQALLDNKYHVVATGTMMLVSPWLTLIGAIAGVGNRCIPKEQRLQTRTEGFPIIPVMALLSGLACYLPRDSEHWSHDANAAFFAYVVGPLVAFETLTRLLSHEAQRGAL